MCCVNGACVADIHTKKRSSKDNATLFLFFHTTPTIQKNLGRLLSFGDVYACKWILFTIHSFLSLLFGCGEGTLSLTCFYSFFFLLCVLLLFDGRFSYVIRKNHPISLDFRCISGRKQSIHRLWKRKQLKVDKRIFFMFRNLSMPTIVVIVNFWLIQKGKKFKFCFISQDKRFLFIEAVCCIRKTGSGKVNFITLIYLLYIYISFVVLSQTQCSSPSQFSVHGHLF